jgi:hypothetical protein
MGASDLRVTVDLPKLRCVVDPALALDHAAGPALTQRLTGVFETWLTRSFWQLIDASDLLRGAGPDPAALDEWIRLRDRTDAGSWLLRWVGDNRAESQLKAAAGDDLVERYEWLAAALESRQPPVADWRCPFDRVTSVVDALTLSATLEGALILSQQPATADTPWAVQALQRLGLPCEEAIAGTDNLFAIERQVVRQGLAAAGLAALLQALPPLAVVHVLVSAGMPFDTGSADERPDPWTQVRAWWYRL